MITIENGDLNEPCLDSWIRKYVTKYIYSFFKTFNYSWSQPQLLFYHKAHPLSWGLALSSTHMTVKPTQIFFSSEFQSFDSKCLLCLKRHSCPLVRLFSYFLNDIMIIKMSFLVIIISNILNKMSIYRHSMIQLKGHKRTKKRKEKKRGDIS